MSEVNICNQFDEIMPTCPYCKYEIDLCELGHILYGEQNEKQCTSCEKNFYLTPETSFSVDADCVLNSGEHQFIEDKTMLGYSDKFVWLVCLICQSKKTLNKHNDVAGWIERNR